SLGEPLFEIVPLLEWPAIDEAAFVRRAAAIALARCPGPRALSLLVRLARDPDPRVRAAAVESLGHKAPWLPTPILREACAPGSRVERAKLEQLLVPPIELTGQEARLRSFWQKFSDWDLPPTTLPGAALRRYPEAVDLILGSRALAAGSMDFEK